MDDFAPPHQMRMSSFQLVNGNVFNQESVFCGSLLQPHKLICHFDCKRKEQMITKTRDLHTCIRMYVRQVYLLLLYSLVMNHDIISFIVFTTFVLVEISDDS